MIARNSIPWGYFDGDIPFARLFRGSSGEAYTQYNIQNIVGGFTGTGICPAAGTILSGALGRCQRNQRRASNVRKKRPLSPIDAPFARWSEINPGQFSKSSGLGQGVDDQGDGFTTQQALEINIGKTMFKWNHESVQTGKTLNEQFQLYNSESRARRIAYAKKAEASHNSIHASHRFVSSRTNGWFLSRGRPSSAPLIGVSPCGVLSRCPNFKF